jgi:hypothetical protein
MVLAMHCLSFTDKVKQLAQVEVATARSITSAPENSITGDQLSYETTCYSFLKLTTQKKELNPSLASQHYLKRE